jgi:hypothetical protein
MTASTKPVGLGEFSRSTSLSIISLQSVGNGEAIVKSFAGYAREAWNHFRAMWELYPGAWSFQSQCVNRKKLLRRDYYL